MKTLWVLETFLSFFLLHSTFYTNDTHDPKLTMRGQSFRSLINIHPHIYIHITSTKSTILKQTLVNISYKNIFCELIYTFYFFAQTSTEACNVKIICTAYTTNCIHTTLKRLETKGLTHNRLTHNNRSNQLVSALYKYCAFCENQT